MKQCVLHAEKTCTNCGECDDRCERDPQKICDNCFRCLETNQKPFLEIPVSGVYFEDDFTPEPVLPVELALDEDEEEEDYVFEDENTADSEEDKNQ